MTLRSPVPAPPAQNVRCGSNPSRVEYINKLPLFGGHSTLWKWCGSRFGSGKRSKMNSLGSVLIPDLDSSKPTATKVGPFMVFTVASVFTMFIVNLIAVYSVHRSFILCICHIINHIQHVTCDVYHYHVHHHHQYHRHNSNNNNHHYPNYHHYHRYHLCRHYHHCHSRFS